MLQTIKPDTQAIKARCLKVIDGFAHRDALRSDDIRDWVSAVAGAHGEMAVWHATRAGGFGGSDIGVLVRNYTGARADHMNSAHDIVQSKLLRSLPDADTGDLRRGHENEALHAQKFYAKYGAVRDEQAFSGLAAAQGLRRWMRYSPDDVVLMPWDKPNPALSGAKARRILLDYKAPRAVDDDDSISFQYSCQLHQGAMICAKANIALDGLMLSQYDWAAWGLKDDYVAYDPELAKLILQAGDYYWGFVMRGELPPYILTPRFEAEDEYIRKFGQKAQTLAQLKAAADAFGKEAEFLADELKAALKGARVAGTRMQLGDLSVTAVQLVNHAEDLKLLDQDAIASLRKKGAKAEYDADAMATKLSELGVDLRTFRVDKVDAEKAYAHLADRGYDPEAFMTEQIRLSVAEHLKEAAREVVAKTYPRVADAHTQIDSQDTAAAANDAAAEPDVREGQSTERLAPRTAMA
jgi:hypothetical protein